MSSSSAKIFRFGQYEFRAAQGELRKSGRLLKLQPQPARLLLLLVSNPGQVVGRRQIEEAVWGSDVTVDYELGINRCIRQIRSILLDNSDAPRYIKTIPRQGYSFIAPVEQAAEVGPHPALPPEVIDDLRVESAVAHQTTRTARPVIDDDAASTTLKELPGPRRLRPILVLLTALLLVIGTWRYLNIPAPLPRVESYSQLTNDTYTKVVRTGDAARSIVTDGSRIYFAAVTGAAAYEIAEVAVTGGETSIVHTSLTSPIVLDVSASRSELLLASGIGIGDLPLWIQPLPTGSVRRISELLAHGASWSPDRAQLAYANANGLYLASGSGMNSKLLASFDGRRGRRPYWPRWSPDGASIRFSLYDGSTGSKNSLWEVSSRGGDPHSLLPDWKQSNESCCGTWTPDGRYYVFAGNNAGRSDIWGLPENTGILSRFRRAPKQPIQLTSGPLSYYAPVVSKDGGQIFVIGNASRGELTEYDSASLDFRPLAPGVSASQADFSRDGNWLAFVSFDGSLWRSERDGSGRTQLSFAPLKATLPRWSPDGTSIAFFGHLPDEPNSIYLIPGHGGALRRLVSEKNYDEMDPDWSADGQRLVFSESSLTGKSSVIKIVDVGNGQTSMLPGSAGLRSPRWSPDGRYISASTSDLGSLMLYDTEAIKNWTRIASFRMGYPNWSHDSRYIYFVNLSGRPCVSRIRLADHTVAMVVDMAGRSQYWTEDVWLGLTPADAPLLARDTGMQQVFSLHWAVK